MAAYLDNAKREAARVSIEEAGPTSSNLKVVNLRQAMR